MTGTRCEYSELPADQCACEHCAPTPVSAPRDVVTARFAARYPARCAFCDRRIREGDPIARTDNCDYICDDCADGIAQHTQKGTTA